MTNFYPNSIGLFYSTIADFYFDNDGEFKVMSLSSYGNPIYEKEMDKIFDCERLKNSYTLNFKKILKDHFQIFLLRPGSLFKFKYKKNFQSIVILGVQHNCY